MPSPPLPTPAAPSSTGNEFDALLAPARTSSGDPHSASAEVGTRPVATTPVATAPVAAAPAGSAGQLETAIPGSSVQSFVDNWTLYRDPVLAGTFAGIVLGLAGVFVLLRRAVFVTAAVSQSAALGVASAFWLGIVTGIELPPVLLAFAFGAAGALLLAFGNPKRLPREATVGIVYLASGALAVIVGSQIRQEAHDVAALLFGSAVLVRPVDLWLVTGVGAVVAALLLALARALEFSGFDPEAARVQGLPLRRIEATLWLLVAAEVAVATRALGALPVFAFAVLPAFGALQLARRLPLCLALAAAFGGASGALGYLVAFLLDWPVGASQTAVATVIALTALAARRALGAR